MSNFGKFFVQALIILLCALGTGIVRTQAAQDGVIPVGVFSDIKYTDEECVGYSLSLWQSGDQLLGIIKYCAALVDNMPVGLLIDPSYDAQTHKLSFQSKLSIGSDYLSNAKQVPSQDLWSFDGILKANIIVGTLTERDQVTPTQNPALKLLKLKKQLTKLDSFQSPQDWTHWVNGLLLVSGPKW